MNFIFAYEFFFASKTYQAQYSAQLTDCCQIKLNVLRILLMRNVCLNSCFANEKKRVMRTERLTFVCLHTADRCLLTG